MSASNVFISFILIIAIMITVTGCMDDTTGLQQKLMTLEKRLAEQEKAFNEFSTKFDPSNDYSVDIRRIEDQQQQFAETLKEVGPINSKLEEFRDWAQESQKIRNNISKRLQALEQSVSELTKRSEGAIRESGNLAKRVDTISKHISANKKGMQKLEKRIQILRKDVVKNYKNLVHEINTALKLTRSQTAESIKTAVFPLEKRLQSLGSGSSVGGKNSGKASSQTLRDSGRDVRLVRNRLKELEGIVAAQKTYLLELGHKVHELEKAPSQ